MQMKRQSLPILPAGDLDTAVDPVCGMKVEKATARLTLDHNGERYYFCSPSCRERFAADPESFLTAAEPQRSCCTDGHKRAPSEPAAPDAIHTCPMHPEVRQQGPGACPKCGMALEAEAPSVGMERIEYICPM